MIVAMMGMKEKGKSSQRKGVKISECSLVVVLDTTVSTFASAASEFFEVLLDSCPLAMRALTSDRRPGRPRAMTETAPRERTSALVMVYMRIVALSRLRCEGIRFGGRVENGE